MRELFRSRHFVVTIDEEARVVRRARSAETFASIAEIETEYDALVRALDGVNRARYAMLVDARSSPARNDPQFEAVVEKHHAELYRDFLAVVVLVQTAVGKLQVKRMLDASGVKASVVVGEEEAMRVLEAAVAGSRVAGSRRPPG